MSLDLSKLDNLHEMAEKTIARCPACAEKGEDRSGDHLVVRPDGRFGCVVYSGITPEAKRHRSRIFALCGVHETSPLTVNALANTGDVQDARPIKTDILGRLGRLFVSRPAPGPADATPSAVGQHESVSPVPAVPSYPASIESYRPLTERELMLLHGVPVEDRPLVIFALNLFRGAIVG
ncbi:MAG TPA: hypothetical protein VIW07_12965 [Candidatus Udaeobacter sp.]|jgi:hypothetical protein